MSKYSMSAWSILVVVIMNAGLDHGLVRLLGILSLDTSFFHCDWRLCTLCISKTLITYESV